MERIFEVTKLLKAMSDSKHEVVILDGVKVRNSQKYHFFYKNGLVCRCCKREVSYAVISRQNQGKSGLYHLSFYIEDERKGDIILTIDHVVPKALGGASVPENYQVLCESCNRKKGDKILRF